MKVTVIHDPVRLDRCKYIAQLHKLFPNIVLTVAQKTNVDKTPAGRATRGCSLSHLLAVQALLTKDEPVLVLEDDAEVYEGGMHMLTPDMQVPVDAGIILLGSECLNHGPITNGFALVHPPMRGSHAVLYLPSLANTKFLEYAFQILASQPMDSRDVSANGLCHESVILQAVLATGLKMYRPEVMGFTAAPGYSDREQQVIPGVTRV